MMMTIEQALAYWVRNKKLTKKKALELVDSLPPGLIETEHGNDMSHRAIGIFAAVGGILVGLGAMLFVASNWEMMLPVTKMAVLIVAMLATAIAGYHLAFERRAYRKTGLALLFVNALLYGASIFLVAQIYHLPLNFWWGGLLWFIGTALFAFILQSRLHLWTAVPLLILTLGWLRVSTFGGSGEWDFFFNAEHSILNIMPVMGLALTSASILLRKWNYMAFGSKTLFHWGVFLALLVLVVSTFEKEVFYQILYYDTDPVNIGITLVSLLLFAAALAFGRFETPQGRWGLVAFGLYLLFVYVIARTPVFLGLMGGETGFYGTPAYFYGRDISMLHWFFILHILLSFVFFLVVIWYGTLLRMSVLINLGMIAVAAGIFVQYVSWAYDARNRSLAFVIGGLIILGMSFVLERQRQKIIASIAK